MSDKLSNPLSIPSLSSDPASSDTGYIKIFGRTDGNLYGKDHLGNRINLSPRESFGINILGGTSDITVSFKGMSRIKSTGTIVAYRLDSFASDGTALSGSISIEVSKNGTLIGTASLSSASTNYDTTLTGWTTSITEDDKITYEVVSNTGIKNIVLTFYFINI